MAPALEYLQDKEFDRSFRRLQKKGGPSRVAAEEARDAIALWAHGHAVTLPKTKHGETRIKHVVKYDLQGFHRLVVWENDGLRVPLYIGNHDDVDHWLDVHRGYEFVFHTRSKEISFVPGKDADREVDPRAVNVFGEGPILDRIPEHLLTRLNLPDATLAALRRAVTFESVDRPETQAILEAFTYPSSEIKTALLNAICRIAFGQEEVALVCLETAIGDCIRAANSPKDFANAATSNANSHNLAILGGMPEEEIKHLLSLENFAEWMLFLHPDQQALVTGQFEGPARLLGISGSGKTCVLVHRACHLARTYSGERILIVTLSRALTKLIEFLVDALCPPTLRPQITVTSTYDYCYSMVKAIEPRRLIEQLDPRSGEDLEICWSDFLQKPHAMENYSAIAEILEERQDPVNPSAYLLDELIWIRSGFGYENRTEYLSCDRISRGISFPRYDRNNPPESGAAIAGIPADIRPRMLNLLRDYEDYMQAGGLLDPDGVSLAAYSLRNRLHEFPALRARCVLVDEVQDLSTLELAVVNLVCTSPENGLFLCGDQTQKVFPKQQNLQNAGVDIIGRGRLLRRNYRNTRQILEASFRIIRRYSADAAIDASEIMEPEFAFRDGYKPDFYECTNREQQIDVVMAYIEHWKSSELDAICVCSASEITLTAFEAAARAKGLETSRLTGNSDYDRPGIRVSKLEFVKGHEFAHVFLLDVSDSVLPRRGIPPEEYWRDAFQVYVAMTRARDNLVMTYVHNRSILTRDLGDAVQEALASDLLE